MLLALALAAFTFLIVFGVLRLQSTANVPAKNARRIAAAIDRMRQRPYGAYVIVEEPEFGKAVQMSGSVSEPLFFDLPCHTLTMDEYDRACTLFRDLGHGGPDTFPVYDPAGGRPAGTQTSFTLAIGDDSRHAARLALQVFAAVYQVREHVELKIIEQ